MLRILFFIILFFISVNSALSQTLSSNKQTLDDKLLSEKSNDSLFNNSKINLPVPKTAFDSSQKIAPEVFYIVNDKPVSREEYLRHNKKQ